ncbi:G-type lectin S-receptor-like serine/threonine-protein kinase At2g19130 [Cryptomeria japonica]|nr:G-type lectin S-receptor-like serine/threonine-protein kinase At2g19130 [Cryptomeria japonica]
MEKREKSWKTLFFALTVFSQLKSYGAAIDAGDTLSLGASLTGTQTIISQNGTFELGFFSPNGSNWYIGIWETPARNRSGVLKLSREGNLVLFDAEGASIRSVNTTKKASRAVIIDSGNFLMLKDDNKYETVWQSFDNPVNTWLPGMRFGGQQKLVSWKNPMDPTPGLFSFRTDPSGAKQFVLTWNKSIQYWETGTWDGKIFSKLLEMANLDKGVHVRAESRNSGFYTSITLLPEINVLPRFVLTNLGGLQINAIIRGSKWNTFWSQPADACAVYGLCGAYGTCNSNNLHFCSCVEGFAPTDNGAWDSQDWGSSGCVRQSPLNCDAKNGSTDRFVDLNVTLPNDYTSS